MSSAFERSGELLRVTDLHSFYGESHILHGIDLTVNERKTVPIPPIAGAAAVLAGVALVVAGRNRSSAT